MWLAHERLALVGREGYHQGIGISCMKKKKKKERKHRRWYYWLPPTGSWILAAAWWHFLSSLGAECLKPGTLMEKGEGWSKEERPGPHFLEGFHPGSDPSERRKRGPTNQSNGNKRLLSLLCVFASCVSNTPSDLLLLNAPENAISLFFLPSVCTFPLHGVSA